MPFWLHRQGSRSFKAELLIAVFSRCFFTRIGIRDWIVIDHYLFRYFGHLTREAIDRRITPWSMTVAGWGPIFGGQYTVVLDTYH